MGSSKQIAYAAGLVEGDGSINLTNNRGTNYFTAALNVRMRDHRALNRIAGVLGGVVRPDSQEGMWNVQISSGQCAKACSRILPFLTVKRAQAELVLEFQKHVDHHLRSSRNGRSESGAAMMSPEVVDERMKMCERMRALHVPSSNDLMRDVGVKKDELYAYAAGLVDAEGSITIIKSGRGMLPAVLMQMTERDPMERMVRIFGGHVHEEVRRTKRGKVVYSWRLTSDNASAACKEMMPYLIAKRAQAEIIVRFQNNVQIWVRRLGFGNKHIPDRVRVKRAAMIEQVRALNTGHKFAAAETESRHPHEGSDSPSSHDGKVGEHGRNDHALATAC